MTDRRALELQHQLQVLIMGVDDDLDIFAASGSVDQDMCEQLMGGLRKISVAWADVEKEIHQQVATNTEDSNRKQAEDLLECF